MLGGIQPSGTARRCGCASAAGDITVAQLLEQSGFHTGIDSANGIWRRRHSGAPWNKGFDEFAGYLDPGDAENYYADFVWRHDSKTGFHGKEPLIANAGGAKREYIPIY